MNNIDDYLTTLEKLGIIPEKGIKAICEKVRSLLLRLRKYFVNRQVWYMCGHL
jgi:hypothetical protein